MLSLLGLHNEAWALWSGRSILPMSLARTGRAAFLAIRLRSSLCICTSITYFLFSDAQKNGTFKSSWGPLPPNNGRMGNTFKRWRGHWDMLAIAYAPKLAGHSSSPFLVCSCRFDSRSKSLPVDMMSRIETDADAKYGRESSGAPDDLDSPSPPSQHDPPVDEAKLLRKVDWHVLPILFAIYVVSFLDR